MDLRIFNDIGSSLMRLKMYPYFDVANYVLMSLAVREDTPQTGSTQFSRRHPFACWLATMVMCFAGNILGNFLLGESILAPFQNHEDIALASVVWYIVNYSPLDVVYRIVRLLPVKLFICVLKEVQRTRKIHHGIEMAYKLFPNAYLICIVIGVVKGSGYTEIKIVERLIRGVWLPASNEFLKPSFTSKASVAVSVLFLLETIGYVAAPSYQIYLAAVAFLVYFRISSLILGIHDPFAPFENLFCALFMGGLVDAMRRGFDRAKDPAGGSVSGSAVSGGSATHLSSAGASSSNGSGTASAKGAPEEKKNN